MSGDGWVRQEPLVARGGHVGGDPQVGEAYTARWVRRHGDMWAVATRSFYVASAHGESWVECQTEFLVCTNPDDPGGSEVWSDVVYQTLPGDATSGAAFRLAEQAEAPSEYEWAEVT